MANNTTNPGIFASGQLSVSLISFHKPFSHKLISGDLCHNHILLNNNITVGYGQNCIPKQILDIRSQIIMDFI